jgi:hypothetical protein
LRLVLVEPMRDGGWLAVPYNLADAAQRFRLQVPLIVRLVDGGQPFERVIGRVEGTTIWYDEPDRRGDPALAEELRARLASERNDPGVKSLGQGEQVAYALRRSTALLSTLRTREAADQARVRAALALGGARLVGIERTEWGVRVTWEREGQRRVTIVDDRLQVISAGICLSDRDGDFDLTSIVGVMRQAPWDAEADE